MGGVGTGGKEILAAGGNSFMVLQVMGSLYQHEQHVDMCTNSEIVGIVTNYDHFIAVLPPVGNPNK